MADRADVSYCFANSDVGQLFVSIKIGWRVKYDRWAFLSIVCELFNNQCNTAASICKHNLSTKNQPLWTVPECCPLYKMAALIYIVFCFHSLFRIINDLWMIEKLVLYVSFFESLFMRQKMKNQYEIQLSLYSPQRDVTDVTKFKTEASPHKGCKISHFFLTKNGNSLTDHLFIHQQEHM